MISAKVMRSFSLAEARLLFSRFEGKYSIDELTGCWQWGASNNRRYPLIGFNKRIFYAHRISLAVKINKTSFEVAMHSCDNPLCVNPNHLYEGNTLLNAHDCKRKGRAAVGVNHGMSKLSELQVSDIKKLLNEHKLFHREIAAKYGVTRECVSRIKRNLVWKLIKPLA